MPFLVYLLDFSKLGIKLKVLSISLKRYGKVSIFSKFFRKMFELLTEKSWNINFCMRESPVLAQYSGMCMCIYFSSILIQIKVIAQTLSVSRDLWEAHFLRNAVINRG